MGSWSIWHWLVVLVIVLAVFGTKKIGNIGSDLGKAMRDFKKGLGDGDDKTPPKDEAAQLKAHSDAVDAVRRAEQSGAEESRADAAGKPSANDRNDT